ncbi:hypothetical protein [Niabella hibiscisoli]|uniref:hypothetical protein n=1 Tax=Niabella hibiscisoli TaxID=1825928 RepID=UPI001F1150B9|nr:hypothetical protein [Niabella hibiscisoli]MCH5716770.1 hypothetical protein [Niabella hibiscisoli]
MKRTLLLAIFLCFGMALIAQKSDRESPYRTESFNVATIKTLKVETSGDRYR